MRRIEGQEFSVSPEQPIIPGKLYDRYWGLAERVAGLERVLEAQILTKARLMPGSSREERRAAYEVLDRDSGGQDLVGELFDQASALQNDIKSRQGNRRDGDQLKALLKQNDEFFLSLILAINAIDKVNILFPGVEVVVHRTSKNSKFHSHSSNLVEIHIPNNSKTNPQTVVVRKFMDRLIPHYEKATGMPVSAKHFGETLLKKKDGITPLIERDDETITRSAIEALAISKTIMSLPPGSSGRKELTQVRGEILHFLFKKWIEQRELKGNKDFPTSVEIGKISRRQKEELLEFRIIPLSGREIGFATPFPKRNKSVDKFGLSVLSFVEEGGEWDF